MLLGGQGCGGATVADHESSSGGRRERGFVVQQHIEVATHKVVNAFPRYARCIEWLASCEWQRAAHGFDRQGPHTDWIVLVNFIAGEVPGS